MLLVRMHAACQLKSGRPVGARATMPRGNKSRRTGISLQVKKLLGITLGIMTALGGFVDLGQIVFTLQAGASFRYALLWPIVLGTAAIIVYMEMCGRVAVIARKPVFAVVHDRLGDRLG